MLINKLDFSVAEAATLLGMQLKYSLFPDLREKALCL